MEKIIAFAGKGGTGKTTICGMLIHHLCATGRKPVLAVDADANSNLNEVLGTKLESTYGALQEELRQAKYKKGIIPEGIDKKLYTELKLNMAISEDVGYDLLVMGRSQGKGCYCNVSSLLEKQLEKVQKSYPYIVVDNEAGMEHLSRGILPKIDVLILVSDCSRRGIRTAGRIAQMVKEIKLYPKKMGLVVNRVPGGILSPGTAEEIEKQNLNLIATISKENTVYEYDCAGIPLTQIPKTAPIQQSIQQIAETLKL